jgi:hypothetical protein
MNAQELIQFKLQPAIKECDQHKVHLQSAWQEAITYPELQPEAKDITLTDSQIRTLDQLVFRFGKLQDAIGMRLLPALLQLLQEWQDNEAFLDKLNRAEKLGLLASAEQWLFLRELRNQTTHEYPDNPEIVINNLRRLVNHVPKLIEVHEKLTKAAQERLPVA